MSDNRKTSWENARCSGSRPALAQWMQEKLESILREKGTTAVCAAACVPGELLAAACAGTRGFEDSEARVDDLYNIGSVSKVYVAAAIMKLVQEGKVSLDGPVVKYLPDWKLADGRFRDITLRMLLNHSSGIPGTNLHDHLVLEEGEELFTGKYRNTQAYWQAMKLRARPGSFSSYSNDGYDLLAEVVEAVTGEPYIRWLREQITLPAGLFSVGAGRRLAEGYVKVSCKGMEPEYYNCFGAGAIHTTVPECALFGSLFIDARGIIGQAYLDETRRPQGATFLREAYDAANFCLGWDSRYTRNRIPLGEGAVIKDGGTEQFTSYLLVSPARGLSLAVSATDDGDVWWLEVLEDIGREALEVLGKGRKEEAGAGGRSGTPDRDGQERAEGQTQERKRIEAEKQAEEQTEERKRIETEKQAEEQPEERKRIEAEGHTQERKRIEAEKQAEEHLQERKRIEAGIKTPEHCGEQGFGEQPGDEEGPGVSVCTMAKGAETAEGAERVEKAEGAKTLEGAGRAEEAETLEGAERAEEAEKSEVTRMSETGKPDITEMLGREEKEPFQDIPGKCSGLAYGSCKVYRFTVCENTLNTETLEKGGIWKKDEELSGFRWDGKFFAKGEYDRIAAEEYGGNLYFIRWGEAFCQKNSGYPSPGKLWPRLTGSCFAAEGEEGILGRICLEGINEENVLLFTTDHEEYPVVPLVCDPEKENETCLISETDRDGIVFRLEQEGEQVWLCTGTDRYRRV